MSTRVEELVTRVDILNELIRQRSYLEVGVQHGVCFRAIRGVERKVAVDPRPLFKARQGAAARGAETPSFPTLSRSPRIHFGE